MSPPQTEHCHHVNCPFTQQRPGPHANENRTAQINYYLKEAVAMSNCTDSTQRTSGLSLTELEHLAESMRIKIDTLDASVDDLWGSYTNPVRTVRLHPKLASPQRRCTLAEMIAHVRLVDVNHRTERASTALQMAARMLITSEDWEVIKPVWNECKDGDRSRIFWKFGILPSMVAAYEETEQVWHPEGCVNWFSLCGTGTEDDIHGCIPATIKAGDAAVHTPRMIVGTPAGKYPIDSAITVEVDGALQYGNVVSFEASPAEARKLAWFLLEQAEAVESLARNSAELSDPDTSVTTPELVTAGGGQ